MNEQEIRNIAAVGPGWLDIVVEATAQLRELDPDFTIIQIKEKFGGLRYYYMPTEGNNTATRKAMDDVIRAAEGTCECTCETCGNSGEFRNGGWMRTLCDACEAAYQAKRKAVAALEAPHEPGCGCDPGGLYLG